MISPVYISLLWHFLKLSIIKVTPCMCSIYSNSSIIFQHAWLLHSTTGINSVCTNRSSAWRQCHRRFNTPLQRSIVLRVEQWDRL